MYSRSFYPSEVSAPPENYNGTAFPEPAQIYEAPDESAHTEETEVNTISENIYEDSGKAEQSVFLKLPILSELFGSASSGGALSGFFSNIGIEEILIIAVAAFLFFSKDGDSECAILLILLLFVK